MSKSTGFGAEEQPRHDVRGGASFLDQLIGSGELLRVLTRELTDAVFVKDRQGRYLYTNEAAAKLFCSARQDLEGSYDADFFGASTLEYIRRAERTVLLEGQRTEYEHQVEFLDGRSRILRVTKAPLFDENGTVIGVFALAQNVTEERRDAAHLEQTLRQKDQFIATLGHELRNPITAMRTGLHLQKMVGSNKTVREKTLGIFERQTDQMERLVDDLMDASRLRRGSVELECQRINLRSVVRDVAIDMLASFQDDKLHLMVDLPDHSVWIDGDRTRLAQVLNNLLDNARKASEPHGEVDLSLAVTDDEEQAVVSVRDRGVGLEPDAVDRIFSMFEQVGEYSSGSHGLGLGLTIVKGIVELHDGEVTATSPGPGEGTTFQVFLQMVERPATDPTLEETSSQVRGSRLLVVEDDDDVANLWVDVLELDGHTVRRARNAEEALELVDQETPELILCDLELPGGLSGFELCRALRVDSRFDSLPIIAVTGRSSTESRERAFQAGFDEFLTKPIAFEQLRKVLEPYC